ncbi:MAG: AAA family ATPase [Chloroflexi bacterium]|nr:AAA family ATPase [Chloroflexota bacterium]MCL5108145.1 AAA family ATPase [Chloroflexota bacterium]
MPRVVGNDLEPLLSAVPPRIAEPVRALGDRDSVLEVVMDLGRLPEARLPGREVILSQQEVVPDDIDYVVARISAFGEDNRAGIERTLNRISAIRNRVGRIVGLTCRVGRAVFGTIDIVSDIVESGKSILLLGRPGVGKTTMLREVARVLADDFRKRVVIVDTSNEIAGDGDVPHPAIGRARRMQVPTPALQHAVMIEAVENHMPEVIVIDEIGTELEAAAARTIAERGVQLVGTAHGNTLENLMLNPTLSDLVGGIQTVTLGDEEARRRGTQKTVLERKAPPTFNVLIEIQSWERVAVHENVADVVDSILRGQPPAAELRYFDAEGNLHRERALHPEQAGQAPRRAAAEAPPPARVLAGTHRTRLYPYGVNTGRLEHAVRELEVPVEITKDLGSADAVVTLRNYYRRKPSPLRDAEARGLPVYVLKSNTLLNMQQSLANLLDLDVPPDEVGDAISEAEMAIEHVLAGRDSVELTPQNAYVRRIQHELAERYNLNSRSRGKEPNRRVQIFREENG